MNLKNYERGAIYSSVSNRRACRSINFEKKNPPFTVLFWSARLLILRKKFPLHVYSRTATEMDGTLPH